MLSLMSSWEWNLSQLGHEFMLTQGLRLLSSMSSWEWNLSQLGREFTLTEGLRMLSSMSSWEWNLSQLGRELIEFGWTHEIKHNVDRVKHWVT